jgi:hypothetical protein
VSVFGSAIRLDQRSQSSAYDSEPNAIATSEVACCDGGNLVDTQIEWRQTCGACPQLDGGIDDDPDDIAFISFELAHEQLPAPSRSAPSDPLEGVARLVLAQLAQFESVASARSGAALFGSKSASSSARGQQHGSERARNDLNTQRIGERQRSLEQSCCTLHLEGKTVQGVSSHANGAHM